MNQTDPLDNMEMSAASDDIPPAPDPVDFDFPIVSKRSKEDLQEYGMHMVDDYADFKEELMTWLANYGKNPKQHEGLARTTLESTHYKLETVFRWLWKFEDQYTTEFTPAHADQFITILNHTDSMIDSTVLHHGKDIKRFFRFSNHVRDTNYDWDLDDDLDLSQKNGDERDYLRREAFAPLYQSSLEHSTVKSYYSVTPEERDKLRKVISQRLQIPKSKVGPDEFKKANSWKYPSMIATTLDTGLRPIEVGRATVDWVNLETGELNIPKDESTKNESHWNCVLSSRTSKALKRWLNERESLEKYDDTNALWLTQKSQPYGSKSLNSLLRRVIKSGDVPIPDRKEETISWYNIRHGVATYWANHIGPHHAKEQLRHKSVTTTMKYLHSDSGTREKAVDQLW